MVAHGTSPLHRSASWIRDGWATDRWLFAAVLTFYVACGGSASVSGILVIASHPPPVAVWVLAVVGGLVEVWCRRAAATDTDEFDAADADWEFEQT